MWRPTRPVVGARGLSSVGRALPLQGRSQGFESPRLHKSTARSNANSAMLAQVLRPGGGNVDAGAAIRCRLTVNEATLLSGLSNRQAWARRPPGLKDFGVGPWVRADPFEEIEDEGVDSVGHDGLSHQCAASGFDARYCIALHLRVTAARRKLLRP
jgi:hypothetical protein